VDMVEQTLDPIASSLTFSGGASGTDYPMTLGETAVIWTKRQGRETLELSDSELVFVGYGIDAPEYDWNDYQGLDVAGKTVVMLVNDPGFVTEDPALFNGKAMTYYGRWTYKFEEAARKGAAGAIIVHETEPAAYGWDVVSNSWSGAQADLVRPDGGADRTVLEGWISLSTARKLFAEAGLDFAQLSEMASSPDFKPIDMGDLAASALLAQSVDRKRSRNVVGVLPGAERPDEYVLFSAHWDHLGKKTDEKEGRRGQDFYRDDIFNGAVDNATGVAAILEIAEAFAADRPARSSLFVSVTLEESGLLGSAHYAENPTVPLSQIAGGINIDAPRPLGKTNDMVVIGFGASELDTILADVLETQGRSVAPDPRPEAGLFYRSDHVEFAKKGVPMLYAKNGDDKVEGGVAAGAAFSAVYTRERYHKPFDEFDRNWDLDGLVEDVSALAEVGRRVAQSEDWPEWNDGSEFKAARDASRSGQ
ncbi:MAG: M28 family metallopeptidase, partial [Pseudomonadota bacterium]